MDRGLLEEARDYALRGGGSGMVARSGKLVFSWGSQSKLYDLKSTTKSIGVTALGLALEDGLVDLDDTARSHLPDIGLPPSSNAQTGWLDEITLLHLASHSAGFDKTAGFIKQLYRPGTVWGYSDGGANWLADTLTVLYGVDMYDFLFDRVFDPLGIRPADLSWRNNGSRGDTLNGIKRREFGSGIKADVDAMARLGYLYLRGGAWQGQRIVAQSFVDRVRRPEPSIAGLPVSDPGRFPQASRHYGLLWWNNGDRTLPGVPTDAYWSWGLGDSLILVIPSLDLVAARAGNAWTSTKPGHYSVVEPFLHPIAQSASGGPGPGDGLTVTADTYTEASKPTVSRGKSKILKVNRTGERTTFAAFDVTSLDGPIGSAVLRFRVTSVAKPGKVFVHAVQDAWTENGLTHDSRPPLDAVPLGSFAVAAGDAGSTLSFNLTQAVNEWLSSPNDNHGIAFVPDSEAAVNVQIDSREGAQAMTLEITP